MSLASETVVLQKQRNCRRLLSTHASVLSFLSSSLPQKLTIQSQFLPLTLLYLPLIRPLIYSSISLPLHNGPFKGHVFLFYLSLLLLFRSGSLSRLLLSLFRRFSYPEDGGSKFHPNIGNLPLDYESLHPSGQLSVALCWCETWAFVQREEQRSYIFGNKLLRKWVTIYITRNFMIYPDHPVFF